MISVFSDTFEINKYKEFENNKIDYENILLGTFIKIDLEPKYNT